ncbi:MAG TPA: hypothetical protein VMX13_04860, partial [Sedimentisphaerales bacterium]|nr:hypothetical protein [Sedimentisphaerales bacterium]
TLDLGMVIFIFEPFTPETVDSQAYKRAPSTDIAKLLRQVLITEWKFFPKKNLSLLRPLPATPAPHPGHKHNL